MLSYTLGERTTLRAHSRMLLLVILRFSEQESTSIRGTLLVAFAKAGIELAFDTMTHSGIYPESAYYESLHELPLIANTIARRRLYEMNVVISDTAEYGNYLFANAAIPLLKDFMAKQKLDVFGDTLKGDNAVDNVAVNQDQRSDPQPPYRGCRSQATCLHVRYEGSFCW